MEDFFFSIDEIHLVFEWMLFFVVNIFVRVLNKHFDLNKN